MITHIDQFFVVCYVTPCCYQVKPASLVELCRDPVLPLCIFGCVMWLFGSDEVVVE
jgi:hypothetical protein